MKIKLSTILAAIALIALLVPTTTQRSQAFAQGRHPSYLRALSDLRLARAYLDRLAPSEHLEVEQEKAISEIEYAISDIKRASIDDGKNLNDHPPIDARILPRNRFQKAREALNAALVDVQREEDDPQTKGLQRRSIDHIHEAGKFIENIQKRLHLL